MARTPPARTPTTVLRTAGSTPVPHPSLDAMIPRIDTGDAGPSTATGLPSTIAHHFSRMLDLEAGNYSKWRQLFHVICCKHNMQHHLDDATEPFHESAVWRNDDLTIVLWMYEVIAEDLQDVVMSPTSTAYDVRVQLHMLFRDNQPGRAIILEAEFRNLVQGDLSVAEYSRRLKSLSDALGEVGVPISDQVLTLQLIRGLSRRFQVMATLLPMQSPFPSFIQARSRLLMEELSTNERAHLDGQGSSSHSALAIGHAPANNAPVRGAAPTTDKGKGPASSPPGDKGSCGRGRGRGDSGSGSGSGFSPGGSAPAGRGGPPQPLLVPGWASLRQWDTPFPPQPHQLCAPWSAPNAAGVLGPRPSPPHQAYHVAAPPTAGGPSWEQYHQLNAALHNLSLQQQGGAAPEWFLRLGRFLSRVWT